MVDCHGGIDHERVLFGVPNLPYRDQNTPERQILPRSVHELRLLSIHLSQAFLLPETSIVDHAITSNITITPLLALPPSYQQRIIDNELCVQPNYPVIGG